MSSFVHDAEILLESLQDLLYFATSRQPRIPTSFDQRQRADKALKTIKRLATAEKLRIPGEDAELWSLKLRQAAQKVHSYIAGSRAESRPDDALMVIEQCQQALGEISVDDDNSDENPTGKPRKPK